MNKLMIGFHPFHMVSSSPWPIIGSLGVMAFSSGSVSFFTGGYLSLLLLGILSSCTVAAFWWRDVIREATGMGFHNSLVLSGLQLGVILFILSEIMFFFSLFFGWFFIMLTPDPSVGCMTPPIGVQPLSFLSVPLLNTIILLSSGVSITWSHHAILEGKSGSFSLFITCSLGMIFMVFQCIEYYEIPFSISDSVYGSLFFMATGFHGFHVLIGTSFLLINFARSVKGHFSSIHHFGFEASAWYWHFVDVVWLFLFISIYWWGS
uniref:Cytochrome c oxidase subunit 3 n=1 Tax=Hoplopleura kitti TaxID=1511644 RepID=A0A075EC69_9NEOP|nr:cytochrome c oxidase subunit 3 [Hoplopleura kitti]